MGYLEMKYRGEIQFPPFQAKQLNYSLIRLYLLDSRKYHFPKFLKKQEFLQEFYS